MQLPVGKNPDLSLKKDELWKCGPVSSLSKQITCK